MASSLDERGRRRLEAWCQCDIVTVVALNESDSYNKKAEDRCETALRDV